MISVRTPIQVSRMREEEQDPTDTTSLHSDIFLHIHKPQSSFPENVQFYLDISPKTLKIHNSESFHHFSNPETKTMVTSAGKSVQQDFEDLANSENGFRKIAECRTDEFLDMLKLSKYGIPEKNVMQTQYLYVCRLQLKDEKISSASADGRKIARITSGIPLLEGETLDPIYIPPEIIEKSQKNLFFQKRCPRKNCSLDFDPK